MNGYSPERDKTASRATGGGGSDMRRTFLSCPHLGLTTGAQWKPGLGYIRCPRCNAERLAKAAT